MSQIVYPGSFDSTMIALTSGAPEAWKKYKTYSVLVDSDQDDRAKEIKLYSLNRPHMRAFHCAWWSFFIAYFNWFAASPLLPEMQQTLKLTKEEIWSSSIAGVTGTIFMRFLLGPLCDKYGARVLFSMVLCLSSIPTACTGLVESANGLMILRFFIGLAGGTLVMCQYWTSCFFTKEIVGTANALVAGWGNLGAGVTYLVIGSALLPLFKFIFNGDSEKAWRTVCVVPAFVSFVTGIMIYFVSDDSPKGNFWELKKHGSLTEVSACCLGVELTMNTAAAMYFEDEFGQSADSAAAIAAICGWMNLFARALGGVASDTANTRKGMRGRIRVQTLFLIGEGITVLIFAKTNALWSAIAIMVIFSLFVRACEGATFGIVPYVEPNSNGSVIGIVGAGGSCGAVAFSFAFRVLSYEKAFMIMGCAPLFSAFLSAFLFRKQRGIEGSSEGKSDLETAEKIDFSKEEIDK